MAKISASCAWRVIANELTNQKWTVAWISTLENRCTRKRERERNYESSKIRRGEREVTDSLEPVSSVTVPIRRQLHARLDECQALLNNSVPQSRLKVATKYVLMSRHSSIRLSNAFARRWSAQTARSENIWHIDSVYQNPNVFGHSLNRDLLKIFNQAYAFLCVAHVSGLLIIQRGDDNVSKQLWHFDSLTLRLRQVGELCAFMGRNNQQKSDTIQSSVHINWRFILKYVKSLSLLRIINSHDDCVEIGAPD